ncbi:hypothetical protein acsn021_10970 [Anaerocolumna cellulosilytica]|uniref:Uncharacterized protein n=1 Tax=Anaerocolumna cellulosilytica TaxID=433286 RepID=A0A6S6R3A7_9FIRM|nr:hypothetical protein [Anaerocolumna cellulosilytica]MBB5194584.1 hypothetical protein [Anaerocolumna cellulosilytica]BCJ93528.1 hypothetical protein acsn021_10970 [Anaerocolumna cellulosilytica]
MNDINKLNEELNESFHIINTCLEEQNLKNFAEEARKLTSIIFKSHQGDLWWQDMGIQVITISLYFLYKEFPDVVESKGNINLINLNFCLTFMVTPINVDEKYMYGFFEYIDELTEEPIYDYIDKEAVQCIKGSKIGFIALISEMHHLIMKLKSIDNTEVIA